MRGSLLISSSFKDYLKKDGYIIIINDEKNEVLLNGQIYTTKNQIQEGAKTYLLEKFLEQGIKFVDLKSLIL